jgi:putative nucleotidyltransferase with HDIG domain
MCAKRYSPVSPLLITHGEAVPFNVYLKQKGTGKYILFANSEKLTDKHKISLMENDVHELYINVDDAADFEHYVMENYGRVLSNENIPVFERAKIFYEHSTALSKDTFECHLLDTVIPSETMGKIETILTANYEFVAMNKDAFQNISKLIDHNYKTYNHCVNVSIYTLVILVQLNRFDAIEMDTGVGAFLHDIGKLYIPNEIIDKPGRLTEKEFEIIKTHSREGYEIARKSGLPEVTLDCILRHHEKLDGSGYPGGLEGDDLPYQVQALTIADIYDALTSDRPYSRAYTPFEAMKIMAKDVERGRLGQDIFKLFLEFLSGNLILD